VCLNIIRKISYAAKMTCRQGSANSCDDDVMMDIIYFICDPMHACTEALNACHPYLLPLSYASSVYRQYHTAIQSLFPVISSCGVAQQSIGSLMSDSSHQSTYRGESLALPCPPLYLILLAYTTFPYTGENAQPQGRSFHTSMQQHNCACIDLGS
jgi:hypothetical protein